MLWKLFAFASRYGHQDLSTLYAMPMNDFRSYVSALNTLITEEDAYVANRTDRA